MDVETDGAISPVTDELAPAVQGRTRWAWKATKLDLTTRGGFTWPLNGGVEVGGPFNLDAKEACPSQEGDGLCLAKTPQGASDGGYNLLSSVILLVSFEPCDVLGEVEHKVRVRRCTTHGLLNARINIHPGAYLTGANLRGANLRGANLRGANLADAHLTGANLADADLTDADLRSAYLRGAHLRGANLRGAHLRGANLRGANLRGANLRGANLTDANLAGANLTGADLTGADLTGAWKSLSKARSPAPCRPGGGARRASADPR